MKKLLITIVVLIVLAVGGLFALAALAPMDRIKAEAVSIVKEKTGRDLSYADAKISVWPQIGLKLTDATFSNASWATEKNMVTLKGLDIRLAVMPLLQKRVEVSKVVLNEPVINLEKSPEGKVNWEMTAADKAEAKKEPAANAGAASDLALAFSGLEISKGQLVFNNRQTNKIERLSDINIALDFKDLDSAAKLTGSAIYREKKVNVDADIEKPGEFFDGKASPASIDVKADDVTAKINGVIASKGTYLKSGSMDARISSLSSLMAWVNGTPKTAAAFEKISLSAKTEATESTLAMTGAVLSLDDILAKGNVSLGYGGAKPSVKAVLAIDKIDLDRFVKGSDGSKNNVGASSGGSDWDSTPIDFSGLKAVDADIKATTQGFSIKGADVGPSVLTAVLKDGVLTASSSEASLFNGNFKSNIGVNAASATPSMTFSFVMKNVAAQPVLKTFAGFDKLSGNVDADIDVKTSGNNQKAIVNALAGKGSVTFKNGALEGIDLVNIAKLVQKGLSNMGVGEGKTEFVSLGGTFTIDKGVVSNNDLAMKGPLVQATGSGTINLPAKSLKYRVVPVLTASSDVENAKGLKIPVDIVGPFGNLKIIPDLASVAKDLLQNPEDAKAALKNVKEQGKVIKENFKDIKKDLKADPAAALGGILGGGSLGDSLLKKKTKEPAPVSTVPSTAPATAPTAAEPTPAASAAETAPVPAVPAEAAPEAAPAAQ